MRHTKRAIDSTTVFRHMLNRRIIMVPLAKVLNTTSVKGLRAAKLAFPSDELVPMLLASELATAILLSCALTAKQVLFLCVLC